MVGKFGKTLILVMVLVLALTSVVYAEEDVPQEKVRFFGELSDIELDIGSFSLHSQAGEDRRFTTSERTTFRSRDGSIQSLEDLSSGMKALVSAISDSDGKLVAIMIAAGQGGDFENVHRYNGIIFNVDVDKSSFALEMDGGRIQRFDVGDRTRFRSRDGSISDLVDLETGMLAHVVAIDINNQSPLALFVASGNPIERPERFRVIGQITNVIPGQKTFELETKNGESVTFDVVDRTIFRSRDGSIDSIHDLKKGMYALVVGVRNKDGSLIAYLVAAADLDNSPGLSRFDVRAMGKITSLGDRTFTLETQGQGLLTFSVDGSTIYKSRDGSVHTFEDLHVGMIAAVAGNTLGNDEIRAAVVGVATRNSERTDMSDQVRPAIESPTK